MESLHVNNLPEETHYILEESRIVVPGVQALFGFQLIAVFNQNFSQELSKAEQKAHLLSILLVAVAMVLVLAPAALHRIGDPGQLTKSFVVISSRLLKWAMFFLPIGISIDFYLISRLITDSEMVSGALAAFLLLLAFGFWYAFPKYICRRSEKK